MSYKMKSKYKPILKRRREGKTNYARRKTLIRGDILFIAPRISNRNISAQIIKAQLNGDLTISSAFSKELIQYGWKGSRDNTSAAYLTGFILGLKSVIKGVNKAVLYIGNRKYIPGTRIPAIIKGTIDAGLEVSVDTETLPEEKRLKGEHIAEFAKNMADKNPENRKKRFSAMILAGLTPEEYPTHFEEIKNNISEKFKVNNKK